MSKEADKDKLKEAMNLQEVTGIGEDIEKKLNSLGIHTKEYLATCPIKELITGGIGEKLATKILENIRGTSDDFKTAWQLLQERKTRRMLSTGAKQLDELLQGGFSTQEVSELYGELASGKTQICLNMIVRAALPPSEGFGRGALFLDTENTFNPARLQQIVEAQGLNVKEVLDQVLHVNVYNSDHQMFIIDQADLQIKANNIGLIIVDSLVALFRSEYLGRENLTERQGKLNNHLHKILRLAMAFNCVALATNQVYDTPDVTFYKPDPVAIGGHVVKHTCNLHLFLRRSGAKGPVRIACIKDSSYLPEGERPFRIATEGIIDVPDETSTTTSTEASATKAGNTGGDKK